MAYRTSVTLSDFHPDTRKFFQGKKVAVPGGSGFIGSHAVEQLLVLGARPVVLTRSPDPKFLSAARDGIEIRVCDLRNREQTHDALRGCPVVLNFAAQVAGLEYNAKHPATIFQTNLEIFIHCIDSARRLGVERFLVTSSACVYPRHCLIPTPESEGTRDEPEPTNSGYGWAKRMEEYLGAQYAKEFGFSVAIARPYNSYGPRDNFVPESSHVIPALIRKAFESGDGRLKVWGDGSHSRSFLYVDDFARGCLETAARYPQADPVNIGASEETTIRETAEIIARIVGELRQTEIVPEFDPQGLTGQPRRKCDTSKAERVLGYQAKISFEKGIRETILWFKNQYESSALSPHA